MTISVLVTGVGGASVGMQIVKALRKSNLALKIIGCDLSEESSGLMSVDLPYVVPSAKDIHYIEILLKICKQQDVKVVFPGSEAELKIIAENKELFDNLGIYLPINSKEFINICLDKSQTSQKLLELNIPTPSYAKISDISQLKEIAFLPAIIKPSVGGGGSANVMIAQTFGELEFFCKYMLSLYPEFIVQEYIGTPESEYTVGIMSDQKGNIINSIAVKRKIDAGIGNKIKVLNRTENKALGQYLVISSGLSQGEIGPFKEVTSACEKIAMALGNKSVINIQCRLYQEKVFVFEINPRFSGTTSLRAMVGYNEPDIMIKANYLLENIKPHFPYESGLILRQLEEVLINKNKIHHYRDIL